MVSDIIDRTSRIDTTYLWDYHTVDKHKVRKLRGIYEHDLVSTQMMYPRKETTTSFSTDTKSIDKADKFDISANLKMDFMSICSL